MGGYGCAAPPYPLAAALALAALVVFGEVSFPGRWPCSSAWSRGPLILAAARHRAGAWQGVGIAPVETAGVRSIVEGMPDPAVLLDRAGRVLHFTSAAGQLAPGAAQEIELAQFALRSPEIITALREAIARAEPKRTTLHPGPRSRIWTDGWN